MQPLAPSCLLDQESLLILPQDKNQPPVAPYHDHTQNGTWWDSCPPKVPPKYFSWDRASSSPLRSSSSFQLVLAFSLLFPSFLAPSSSCFSLVLMLALPHPAFILLLPPSLPQPHPGQPKAPFKAWSNIALLVETSGITDCCPSSLMPWGQMWPAVSL